jgi:ATP-dependent helicase/nuclease subunit A
VKPLPDAAARRRAIEDVETSLIVEASAGTGKTATLINRILYLVLEAERPLSLIAAMTFTEKAAGEMKERLRTKLYEISGTAETPSIRERAARARRDVDLAEVSTIHSFCARLLRERPVEAGVDPDFVTPEEGVARELFEDVFSYWIDEEARAGGAVTDALRAGLTPDTLRTVAETLQANRALVLSATIPADPLPFVRAEIHVLAAEGEKLISDLPKEALRDDKGSQLVAALGELKPLAALGIVGLAAFRPATLIDFSRGKRRLLTGDLKERVSTFRDQWRALSEWLATLPDEVLLARVVAAVRDGFLRQIEEEKRRRGLLDFDDLLLSTRDLLRHSRAAREYFQSRFPHLIVDEFQDTDPVQAEIVMRLAAPEGEQDPERWDDLEPAAGALFLVGDPKQSIYRFRRADVEAYREVAQRLGPGASLSLETNFRSSPRLISFINAIFERVFESAPDEPWEVSHSPLAPKPDATDDGRPAVFYLVPPEPLALHAATPHPADDDKEDVAATIEEARAVANFLLSRFASGGRFRDVAVLLGSNDAIDRYQEVFRDAGIPAVLDGGVSFYQREETAAVIAALRAIDDPSDGISTVAALKSLLFGLTDIELLEASEAGGRFDDPTTFAEGTPVAEALAILGRLRSLRHGRPLAETLLDLFSARSVLASIQAGAVVNPLQATANIERLLVLARGLDAEGLAFREAVARLTLRLEERVSEPRAFEEDEDAVRLLTIHKAKGLEFEVVVVASMGFRNRELVGRNQILFHDRSSGRIALRLSLRGVTCGTPGLTMVAGADGLRLLAEEKRLLYVAMTRAKRTLVISWFRRRNVLKGGTVSDAIGKSLLSPIAFAEGPPPELASLVEVVPADISAPPVPLRREPEEVAVDLTAEIDEVEARLERARATASRPLRRSGEKAKPTAAVRAEDLPAMERLEEIQARAMRIGTAVHEAMELLLDPSRIPPISSAGAVAAVPSELDASERSEAERLVSRLLAHPVVHRARAARRRFVELPILFVDETFPESPLVEGKIDLLFEEDDGWVLVDWKTDKIEGEGVRAAREEFYRPQLESYARALRAVLGPGTVVKEALFVFARG